MFGPRDLPFGVEEFYLVQFALLPLLPWRLRTFLFLQFGVFLLIHAAPIWPMAGDQRVRIAVIPWIVWGIYVIQFIGLEMWAIATFRNNRDKQNATTESNAEPTDARAKDGGLVKAQEHGIENCIAIAIHSWVFSILFLGLGGVSPPIHLSFWHAAAATVLIGGLFVALTLFTRSVSQSRTRFCNTIPKRILISAIAVLNLPLVLTFFVSQGPSRDIRTWGIFCFSILLWLVVRRQRRKHGLPGVAKVIFIAGLIGPLPGVVLYSIHIPL